MKHHTIIFVPHARARFRKWRLTNRQLHLGLIAALLLVVGSLFTTWSFLTNRIDRQELDALAAENRELRDINGTFEASIRSLQGQLSQFEEETRQLSIVAGLDTPATEDEAGIGGEAYPRDAPGQAAALRHLSRRARDLGTDLASVGRRLDERDRWISSTPTVAPVKGLLTSGYGYRRDPITGARAPHWAIDIATAAGRPVQATADGVVLRAGRVGGLGNAVVLSHGEGIVTRYGHLSKLSVHPGQKVRRGDAVGFVGNTGRSTGYHLHYEVRVDGKPENPLGYILDGVSPGA